MNFNSIKATCTGKDDFADGHCSLTTCPVRFPVFYLLHGLSDNHTAWLRWSNIDAYVRGLPLIVVMPNGERGFYTDALRPSQKPPLKPIWCGTSSAS